MDGFDLGSAAITTCEIPPALLNSKLDFTREIVLVVSQGRSHPEARCNRCGFRITSADCDGFEREEQEHASSCSGSVEE